VLYDSRVHLFHGPRADRPCASCGVHLYELGIAIGHHREGKPCAAGDIQLITPLLSAPMEVGPGKRKERLAGEPGLRRWCPVAVGDISSPIRRESPTGGKNNRAVRVPSEPVECKSVIAIQLRVFHPGVGLTLNRRGKNQREHTIRQSIQLTHLSSHSGLAIESVVFVGNVRSYDRGARGGGRQALNQRSRKL